MVSCSASHCTVIDASWVSVSMLNISLGEFTSPLAGQNQIGETGRTEAMQPSSSPENSANSRTAARLALSFLSAKKLTLTANEVTAEIHAIMFSENIDRNMQKLFQECELAVANAAKQHVF